MKFARKIKRNQIRKEVGNKNLRKKWRDERIKLIGPINFMIEYNRTTKSHLCIDEIYL